MNQPARARAPKRPAYDQYGIQAVKFTAMDYLVKPENIDELTSAVEKAGVRRLEKQ
jgi:two-component system LytT family response regulator